MHDQKFKSERRYDQVANEDDPSVRKPVFEKTATEIAEEKAKLESSDFVGTYTNANSQNQQDIDLLITQKLYTSWENKNYIEIITSSAQRMQIPKQSA